MNPFAWTRRTLATLAFAALAVAACDVGQGQMHACYQACAPRGVARVTHDECACALGATSVPDGGAR